MLKLIKKTLTAIAIAAITFTSAHARSHTPGDYEDYVYEDDTQHYYETFEADEWAVIELKGDGYSDIDLWVYDELGYLVAKSTSYGSIEYVEFIPQWTGEFTIVVENIDKPTGSDFVLTTY